LGEHVREAEEVGEEWYERIVVVVRGKAVRKEYSLAGLCLVETVAVSMRSAGT
jgi:hypothetical protein